LGPQTNLGAESHSEGTIQLIPKQWKMVIIIPRRRRGTWKGVPAATWCSERIYRMRGGLVHHIIIIPTALSFPLLQGAAVGCALTIFQNDWFCSRISNFFQSPIPSIANNVSGWYSRLRGPIWALFHCAGGWWFQYMMGRGLERGAGYLSNLDPGQNAPSWCMQGTSTSHTYHLTTRLRQVHRVVYVAPLGELCSRSDRQALQLH